MKLYLHFCSAIYIIFLVSCTSPDPPKSQSDPNQVTQSQKVVTLDEKLKIAMGQTIYVPVYSHIYHEDQHKILNLAATLSIRNTDQTNRIIITSVRYYDSDGKLVRQYLTQPIQLGAMASTDFVVARTDSSGGVGANFIVKWVAEKEISEPVVEAVMIGTESSQGISFISSGKVIKSVTNEQ
jgi:PBP1b-binding outer membrane lipoprotein LpoB